MLTAAVADAVFVAPGVLDDDEDLVDAVLDPEELPPQPASTTKAMSPAASPTKLRMLPPKRY
ncbi:MAG TPA: hypothetical protein VFH80_30900 [Solirubrobacteraceae bacterium]|nr:hypothetical protein [Solirubrobacteraceae bacterium]